MHCNRRDACFPVGDFLDHICGVAPVHQAAYQEWVGPADRTGNETLDGQSPL
jgi:hypothetical protein